MQLVLSMQNYGCWEKRSNGRGWKIRKESLAEDTRWMQLKLEGAQDVTVWKVALKETVQPVHARKVEHEEGGKDDAQW